MLLGLGKVPGVIAVVIYAIPPVIRLTNLGLRLVDSDVLEAADAFGVAEYRDRAAAIVADLVASCIVARPDRIGMMLMLPAAQGFQTDEGFIYNPSYAMPLAMMELANAFDAPELASAADGAVQLMRDLASGGVVPDWVLLTPSGPPAAGVKSIAVIPACS